MYTLKKIKKTDISKLQSSALILNTCGKDMARKYDLHHWDNTYLKTFIIVVLSAFKNDIYLVYNEIKPVATFMTKKNGEHMHFEKLGTLPSFSGKGIGSFCMNMIEDSARTSGCKKVVMEVYEPSLHAISFYKHKGYTIVGVKETLKYKEYQMEKSIET